MVFSNVIVDITIFCHPFVFSQSYVSQISASLTNVRGLAVTAFDLVYCTFTHDIITKHIYIYIYIYNKTFKESLKQNDINMYSTFNEGKAVVIERLNRTLKNKMYKQFTVQNNTVWCNILDDLIKKI